MVQTITSVEEFDQLLKDTPHLIVVDFFAVWCGPCRMIAPAVEALAKEYEGAVTFVKVDVDQVTELAQRCGVPAMPTFQFYKDGKKVDDLTGANEKVLREKVARHK